MGNKKHHALSASQERGQDISRRVRLYIGASLQYGNTKVCFAITDRCVGVSTRERWTQIILICLLGFRLRFVNLAKNTMFLIAGTLEKFTKRLKYVRHAYSM